MLWGCNSAPTYIIPSDAYKTLSVQDTHKNVILLTLDGVRWQEFFHGTDSELDGGASEKIIFKNLMKRLSSSGLAIGDRENNSEMTTSNPSLISLPAYQSMMSGLTQNCFSNSCSRVPVETMPERLLERLKLKKEEVATFASWPAISLAVEHQTGRTTINTGIAPFQDPLTDQELLSINNAQLSYGSEGDTRFDKDTIQLALWYLKKHQPRFFYISLNDSDELAHDDEYSKYIEALHQYDEFIENLLKTLESLGEYGKSTTLIITTDHGRGNHGDWTSHKDSIPESKYIWLAAIGPSIDKKITTQKVYQHIDLVPTIQLIMGIESQLCEQCGKPIRELTDSILKE
jgi:hypothetical protein